MVSKNYPINYRDFEEKIIRLALEEYNYDADEFLDFIDELKNQEDGNEIYNLYEDSCSRHDKLNINAFTTNNLKQRPVRLLHIFYKDKKR